MRGPRPQKKPGGRKVRTKMRGRGGAATPKSYILCTVKVKIGESQQVSVACKFEVGKFQQVSVACNSQVLGRQVSASSVSKFSKTQVSASLGKFRQVSAKFRSPSFSKFRRSQGLLRGAQRKSCACTCKDFPVAWNPCHEFKFRQVSASFGFRSASFSKFRLLASLKFWVAKFRRVVCRRGKIVKIGRVQKFALGVGGLNFF